MADTKLSLLPLANTLIGTELVYGVQSNASVSMSTAQIAAFVNLASVSVNLASQTTNILPVAQGGSGVATPGLVNGNNVTITGTWPNQTITTVIPVAPTVNGDGTLSNTGLLIVTKTNGVALGALATAVSVNLASQVAGILPVLKGGTGNATPSLVSGNNVSVTGSWPNQTVTAVIPNVTGDGTISNSTMVITKTNGVAFSALATATTVNLASQIAGILPIINGGTGNSAPALVSGNNVGVSGSWPNQTIYVTSNIVANIVSSNTIYSTTYSFANQAYMVSDAVNSLSVRNGANSQLFNIYQGYTDAADYSRLAVDFTSYSGNATISTQSAGTGVAQGLVLQAATAIYFGGNGIISWLVNSAGTFMCKVDNSFDIGATAGNRPRNLYVANSVTANGSLIANTITSSQGITIGTVNSLTWSLRSRIYADLDGSIRLANTNGNGFTSLLFGANTAAWPGLFISGANAQFRLGDNSGDTNISAANVVSSNIVSGVVGTFTGGTQTANAPALNITQTWNAAANTFTGAVINITDTASSGSSLALDVQKSGSSLFHVNKYGQVVAGQSFYVSTGTITSSVSALTIGQTWNGSANTFTAAVINVNDTASLATSLLFDMQLGSVSKFNVGKYGDIKAANNSTSAFKTITTGTITANTPALNITQTWNASANAFTAAVINITNTADLSSSLLLDLQLNGVSKFNVRQDGYVISAVGVGAPNLYTSTGGLVAGLTTSLVSVTGALSVGGNNVTLYGDTANALSLRNGTNSQVFNIYQGYTDAADYSRLSVDWTTYSGAATISTQYAGTGVSQNFVLQASGTLYLGGGANAQWALNTSGILCTRIDGVYDIGLTGNNRPRNIYIANNVTSTYNTVTGGTVTANMPALNISQTWNAAANTFTAAVINVTETAASSSSLLLDLQIGGLSKFNVRQDGLVTSAFEFSAPIVRTYPTTYASLPSATTAGAGCRKFITDATVNTFGAVVSAGGGTYVMPVWTDGTNWYIG